jgi:hypothetical protein
MKLTVCFRDFWRGFNVNDNFLVDALSANFEVEVADDAEVCIYSVFGRTHETFRGLKIQISGEATSPNWRWTDYSIGFEHRYGDRYLRYPNWCWGIDTRPLLQPLGELRGNHSREFCLFLVGNPKQSIRNAFFTELSRHRFVTSPGAVFHNAESIDSSDSVDMRQAKLSAMRNFSFNIAMENSQLPGYSTEKISEAFFGGAIPIYWGDPLVNVNFDRRTFLNLASFPSIIELVERVLELDENEQLLEPMLSVAPLHRHTYEEIARPERLEEFLFGAISRARQHPAHSSWNHRATMGRVGRALKFVGVDRVVSWSSQPR